MYHVIVATNSDVAHSECDSMPYVEEMQEAGLFEPQHYFNKKITELTIEEYKRHFRVYYLFNFNNF